MNNNPTLYERAEKSGQASLGLDGQPMGCVIGVYGDAFRPAYCKIAGSKLRCKDCWERKYREAHKHARSFTAEDISEPYLIAGRYTLAELIVPNRKAVRA